jgi:hypothetical protein
MSRAVSGVVGATELLATDPDGYNLMQLFVNGVLYIPASSWQGNLHG